MTWVSERRCRLDDLRSVSRPSMALVDSADSEFDAPCVIILSGTDGLALGTERACGIVGVKNFGQASLGSTQMKRQQMVR